MNHSGGNISNLQDFPPGARTFVQTMVRLCASEDCLGS